MQAYDKYLKVQIALYIGILLAGGILAKLAIDDFGTRYHRLLGLGTVEEVRHDQNP